MNQRLVDKHVDLLSRAVVALRERELEKFGELIDESYRLDVATGNDWRDRLPLPRTMRLALLRAQTEMVAADALEHERGAA